MSRSSIIRLFAVPLLACALAVPAPSQGQETHEVVRGNTLWDLARTFYGDPFQWPRIWEANRDRVQDPDLILPGQVLRIPAEDGTVREVKVMPAEEGGASPVPAAGGREAEPVSPARRGGGSGARGETVFARQRTPTAPTAGETLQSWRSAWPAVTDDAVAGAPFLLAAGAPDDGAVGRIAGFADTAVVRNPRTSPLLYDRLLVDGAAGGLGPGTLWQTYRIDRRLPGVGEAAIPTALVEVVARAGGAPVAEVREQLGVIRVGDRLRRVPVAGLPAGVTPRPVANGVRTKVVAPAEEHAIQTVGDFVFLDVGRGTTSVGDEFVPVRSTDGEPEPEGRVVVVLVGDGYATARIVELRNPVFGTGLEMRMDRRMPGR